MGWQPGNLEVVSEVCWTDAEGGEGAGAAMVVVLLVNYILLPLRLIYR